MTSTRDWSAHSYDRVGAPVQAWGHALLDRLDLRGDETVLDAGCGSGAVTAALLERLPRGRVIAVDGSPSMAERARQVLDPARSEVRVSDLLDLELEEPVDAVFSSATFHWIADHDRLFSRMHAAMRQGGRLVAQCGGDGNAAQTIELVARVGERAPFADHLGGWPGPWNFPSPADTGARLERAGFSDVEVGVHSADVTPEDPAEYFRTIVVGAHLERLPADLHEPFVETLLAGLPDRPTIRHVRLTMSARRPA
jgi:trans-aconitate 2-methyltransferase